MLTRLLGLGFSWARRGDGVVTRDRLGETVGIKANFATSTGGVEVALTGEAGL